MQERLRTEDRVSSRLKGDLTGSCVGRKLVGEFLNSVKGAVQRAIENTYMSFTSSNPQPKWHVAWFFCFICFLTKHRWIGLLKIIH